MPAPPRRSFFVIYRPEDEDDEPPGAGRDPASVSKGQENKRVEDQTRTRTKVVKYCQKGAREHGYRITVKRSRPIKRGKRFESNRGSVEICSLGEEPRPTEETKCSSKKVQLSLRHQGNSAR